MNQLTQINQLIGAILLNGKYYKGRFTWIVGGQDSYTLAYSDFDNSFALYGVVNCKDFYIEFEGNTDNEFKIFEQDFEQ